MVYRRWLETGEGSGRRKAVAVKTRRRTEFLEIATIQSFPGFDSKQIPIDPKQNDL
jgi:hypothetical protein